MSVLSIIFCSAVIFPTHPFLEPFSSAFLGNIGIEVPERNEWELTGEDIPGSNYSTEDKDDEEEKLDSWNEKENHETKEVEINNQEQDEVNIVEELK